MRTTMLINLFLMIVCAPCRANQALVLQNPDISLVNRGVATPLAIDAVTANAPAVQAASPMILFRSLLPNSSTETVNMLNPATISGGKILTTTPPNRFSGTVVLCVILSPNPHTNSSCDSNFLTVFFYDWSAATPSTTSSSVRSSGGTRIRLSLGPTFRHIIPKFELSEAIFSPTSSMSALPEVRVLAAAEAGGEVVMSSPPLDFAEATGVTSLRLFLSPNGRDFHDTGIVLSVTATSALRVGFGFIGRVDDEGWTNAHDVGRLALAAHFGRAVETVYEENMPFGQEQPIRDFLQREGVQMFIMCSSGYYTAVRQVATEYPDIQFAVVTDAAEFMGVTGSPLPSLSPNLNSFFASLTQVRYLSGIVAGALAKATGVDKVGYICAFGDNTQVLEGLNAFARGVQQLSPATRVVTYSISTWANPFTERQAAEQMVADGVTILGHHSDSKDVMDVIAAAGGYGIGSNSDTRAALGERVLTAPMFVWSRLMIPLVQRALDGTLGNVYEYGTLAEDSVLLSPLSSLVPNSARFLVRSESARLRAVPGAYGMFCGPLRDNTGALRAAAGVCLAEAELAGNMSWRVEGVGPMRPFVPTLPTIAHPQALGSIATVGNVLSIAVLAVLALVSALLFLHRKDPAVKHASHRFCQLIVLGCAGMQSSVFLLGMDEGSEEELSAVCQALPWLLGVSFVATFAALFSKVWRVMRLFQNKRMRRFTITDGKLALILAAALLPEVLILLLWTLLAPLRWTVAITERDAYGNPIASVGRCVTPEGAPDAAPFLWLLFAYKLLCLGIGNYLSYVTRRVPTSFNESKWVSLTMFNLIEVLVVLLPLNFVTDLPSVIYFVRAGGVTMATLSVTGFILLTKLMGTREAGAGTVVAPTTGGGNNGNTVAAYAVTSGGVGRQLSRHNQSITGGAPRT